MRIPSTTLRICPNCDRLVADHEDGAHHRPHACFTLSYLAGYMLGTLPRHLEQVFKQALAPLGIEEEQAFVQGFRDGMIKNDELNIDALAPTTHDLAEKLEAEWWSGYKQGWGEYRKILDQCHCGSDTCKAPAVAFPHELRLQPCHCGSKSCLEVYYDDDPPNDRDLLGTVKRSNVSETREQHYWEEDGH